MSKFRDIFKSRPKYVTVKPSGGEQPARDKEKEKDKEKERRGAPEGAWIKCPECKVLIYRKDFERTFGVCEKCGHHFPIPVRDRIRLLVDDVADFAECDADLVPANPLNFPDYDAKKERDKKRANVSDAVITGKGTISGQSVLIGVMEFQFMGGSMGSVVGEKITRLFERATEQRLPVVLSSSSGGARMQEGIISLMQMQKTAAAVEKHSQAGLLYISILVHPTTAGVYGSFASQGDIMIAEPGATVGFAGRSVIEAAVGKRVPPDLQKAETVYQNGFIDLISQRGQLPETLSNLLKLHGFGVPVTKDVPADAAVEEARP